MQYHYVIGYDSVSMKWFVELDTTAYFQDGNVWDDEQYREHFYGWRLPREMTPEEELDQTLVNTLYSLVDIIPVPKEHENV